MKFENNFNSCFSSPLFIPVCFCVFWCLGDEEEREVRVNTAKFPEVIKAKQTNFQCVDHNGKNMFSCHGRFNCWLIRDFNRKFKN